MAAATIRTIAIDGDRIDPESRAMPAPDGPPGPGPANPAAVMPGAWFGDGGTADADSRGAMDATAVDDLPDIDEVSFYYRPPRL